jgi:hypothetical protein
MGTVTVLPFDRLVDDANDEEAADDGLAVDP